MTASTLSANNKDADLAANESTISPSAIALSKLYGRTEMFTFHPSFTSTAVHKTESDGVTRQTGSPERDHLTLAQWG
ncbi:hypothetical protein DC522_26575 [Microvirga sp. KLBC 81]|uniref:hypothetical protein n=1 Tax=Microvirga sp. KLBC 81 TaxID=1862707 RepID=UPI000D51EC5D|nr:hypothetical protein [Microvirga sp. KLBC 81]PVE21433.1 hypothetical protein DC522_26575 [Microvirga sp. KLBC 81]